MCSQQPPVFYWMNKTLTSDIFLAQHVVRERQRQRQRDRERQRQRERQTQITLERVRKDENKWYASSLRTISIHYALFMKNNNPALLRELWIKFRFFRFVLFFGVFFLHKLKERWSLESDGIRFSARVLGLVIRCRNWSKIIQKLGFKSLFKTIIISFVWKWSKGTVSMILHFLL